MGVLLKDLWITLYDRLNVSRIITNLHTNRGNMIYFFMNVVNVSVVNRIYKGATIYFIGIWLCVLHRISTHLIEE